MGAETTSARSVGQDRTLEPLLRDLLHFVAAGPRSYAEVMEAWRTSCPRLPIWEEATERGLLTRARDASGRPTVELTRAGRAFLRTGSPAHRT
jgi:D-3-phosphoglycerate dehydrogenase